MFWSISVALFAVYAIRLIFQLLGGVRIARSTGLPYAIYPISEQSLLYQTILDTRLVPYVVNRWLSQGLADFVHASVYKYRWTVKDRMRRKYGAVYLIVTPGSLTCIVDDASVACQVCMARQTFMKPVEKYGSLAIYGPNIVTTEKSEWSHHRRHTATSFNEKNNALVWKESIRQATEMLDYWVDRHSRDSSREEFALPDAREDILKLTLNVICSAGFGVKLPFKPAPQATAADIEALFKDAYSPPSGYHFTFRSVMEYMNHEVRSVFIANALRPQWIPRAMLPFYKTEFNVYDDLGNYLRAMVNAAGRDESRHNLLDEMVRARQADREKARGVSQDNGAQNTGLSEAEILGNLYIFTIAGHETTATTLRFALVLLALHPQVQDELHQEIRDATRDEPVDPAEWDYNRAFPKLVSPLCVMLETLRLYPPVVSIPKRTDNAPASITYRNQAYHLPPQLCVNLNVTGLHYAEEYWGPDAAMFKPQRWDRRNRDSALAGNENVGGLLGPGLEYETIYKPMRGSYIPFSDGVRACLGKKFAQVEFVVVIAVLFRDYRVDLARTCADETAKDTRKKATRVVQESSSFITLAMQDKVPLSFRRRNLDMAN